MGNSVFISIKFRYLLIHLVGLGVAYSREVDDSTTFPIRLTVIDGDGFPAEVEMYKERGHYVFKPISPNGTDGGDQQKMLKNLNLELGGDPDPEIEEALEGALEENERSRWIEPDENFERREATETNIDTPLDQVKSPSSHEQSFNQSPFKQTGSTFPPPPPHLMKKENKSKESEREEESLQGRSAVDESRRRPLFGDIFTENEPKEFHLFTEPPNTISPFDKNDNGNGHEGANNWKESERRSDDESSQPTSTLPSTQDKGLGLGESSQSQSSQISLSPSSTTPKPRNVLPNDLTTLSHAQNKGLQNDNPSRSAALPPSFEKFRKSQGSAEMLSEHKNISGSGSRLHSDFQDATAGIENHLVTNNLVQSGKRRFSSQPSHIITSSKPEIIKALKGNDFNFPNNKASASAEKHLTKNLGAGRTFVRHDSGTSSGSVDSQPQGKTENDALHNMKNIKSDPSPNLKIKDFIFKNSVKSISKGNIHQRYHKKILNISRTKLSKASLKAEMLKASKVIKVKFGQKRFTFIFRNNSSRRRNKKNQEKTKDKDRKLVNGVEGLGTKILSPPPKKLTQKLNRAAPNIENVTCLSAAKIDIRRQKLTSIYHPNPTATCPATYPCANYKACRLWKSGLVGEELAINMQTSVRYFYDLFEGLDPDFVQEIGLTFQKCVERTGITIPFSRLERKNCESRVHNIRNCLLLVWNKGVCYESNLSSGPAYS